MSNSLSSDVSDDIFADSSGHNTPITISNKKCKDIYLQSECLPLDNNTCVAVDSSGEQQGIYSDARLHPIVPDSIYKELNTSCPLEGSMSRKSLISVKDYNFNASIILPEAQEKITFIEDSDKSVFEMSLVGSDNSITNEISSNINVLNSAKKHIIKNWLSNVPLNSSTKLHVEASIIERDFNKREARSYFGKETNPVMSSKAMGKIEDQEENTKNNEEFKESTILSEDEHNIYLNSDSPKVLECRKLTLNSNRVNIKKEEQQNPKNVAGRYNLRRNQRQGKENLHEDTFDICTKESTNSTRSKPKISYRQKKKVKKYCGDEEEFMTSIINSVMSTKLSSDDESFSSARRKGVTRVLTGEDSPNKHPLISNSDIFTPRRKLFFRKPIDNSFDDEIGPAEPCVKLSLASAAATSTPMPKSGRLKGLGGLLSETLNSSPHNILKDKSNLNKQPENVDSFFDISPKDKGKMEGKNVYNRIENSECNMDISPISDKCNIMRCLESRKSGSSLGNHENSQCSLKTKSSNEGIFNKKTNAETKNIEGEDKIYGNDISYSIKQHNVDIDSHSEDYLAAADKFETIKSYGNDIYKETTQNNMSDFMQSHESGRVSDSGQVNDSNGNDSNLTKVGCKINWINSNDIGENEIKEIMANKKMCNSNSMHNHHDENIPIYNRDCNNFVKSVTSNNFSNYASNENSKDTLSNVNENSCDINDVKEVYSINSLHVKPIQDNNIKRISCQEKLCDNFGESLASIDSILNFNSDESNQDRDCSAVPNATSWDSIDRPEVSPCPFDSCKPSLMNGDSQSQSGTLSKKEDENISGKSGFMKLSIISNIEKLSEGNNSYISSKESSIQSKDISQMSNHCLVSHEFGSKSASILSNRNCSQNNSTLPLGLKTSLNVSLQDKESEGKSGTSEYNNQNMTVVISDNDDSFSNLIRSKTPLKKNCLNYSVEEEGAMEVSGAEECNVEMIIEEPQQENSIYECDPVILSREENGTTSINKTETSKSMDQNITTVVLSDSDDSFSNICRSKTPMKKNYLNYSMEGDIIKINDFRETEGSFINKPTKKCRRNKSHDKYDSAVLMIKSNNSSFSSDSELPDACHEEINSSNADSPDISSFEKENEDTPWVDLATYLKKNVPAGSMTIDGGSKVVKKRSLSHVMLPGPSSCTDHTSFLLSLNESVPVDMCHSEAFKFREEFETHKNHLIDVLFKLYNQEIFENKLPIIDIKWSGHLTTTSGITRSNSRITKTGKVRNSEIKLSKTIVNNAAKLRDVLLHELCHAANWLIDEQAGGHGPLFKKWANKVWLRFPEIPRVSVCHRYELKWNYIYKCTYCGYEVGKMKLNINRDTCRLCGGRVTVVT